METAAPPLAAKVAVRTAVPEPSRDYHTEGPWTMATHAVRTCRYAHLPYHLTYDRFHIGALADSGCISTRAVGCGL